MESKTINITLELNDVNKNSIIQTLVGVISDSEQKLAKLSKEVARLKAEKTNLEASCKMLPELENSVRTLNGQIVAFEKLTKRQEGIIDKCNQENGRLTQEKDSIVKERDNLLGEIKAMSEQLVGLKMSGDVNIKQIQSLVSDKTALQKDIETLGYTIDKTKAENSTLKDDLHVLEQTNTNLKKEILDLNETVNTYIIGQKQVVFDVIHEICRLLQEDYQKSSNEALKVFILEICKKDSQKNPGLKQILQSEDNDPWDNIVTKADSSLAKLASLIWWSEQENLYPIVKKQVNNIEKISVLFKSVFIPNLNRFYHHGLELIDGNFDTKIEGYTRDEYGHSNFSKIFPDVVLEKGIWCEIALIRRANSPGSCYYY